VNILLQNKIIARSAQIEEWLRALERDVPLYMSADIRDAGFKIASIDANLYPAGFNNLDPSFHWLATRHLQAALTHYRIPTNSKLLLISEEHTRNTFYLENIRSLASLLTAVGYTVEIATQFPLVNESYVDNAVEFRTASGNKVRLLNPTYAADRLAEYKAVIMNHDSSAGTADWIKNAPVPVLPPWQAGWHSRSKARHFAHYRALMKELAAIVGVDPWFFFPLDLSVTGIDINSDSDRARVAEQAAQLLRQIQAKYDEYQITEKPFVFLKSDHGTYGMAMLSFDSAGEIMEINRKEKNKLFKGKSSVVVKDYLLQEGVPTILRVAGHCSETVVMLANNQFIGCFARANTQKDARTSLNSTGMYFKPYTLAETENPPTRVAALITRVAGIALQREICELIAHGAPGTAEPLPCP
jgi:glutamate--cysteine ligase